MFECKYKYQLEDSLISAKYVFRSQKRKKDKIIAAMIPSTIIIIFLSEQFSEKQKNKMYAIRISIHS